MLKCPIEVTARFKMIYDQLWLMAVINIITPFHLLDSIASLLRALAVGSLSSLLFTLLPNT